MEHAVRFTADPMYVPSLWIDFPLHQYQSFWQRLRLAIRYTFGYQADFGAYDTTIINEKAARKIIEIIHEAYPGLDQRES
jgi:hypothetical protein